MLRRNPVRFMLGLAIELTALVVGVSLLPKLPWNELAGRNRNLEIADERPTLTQQPPEAFFSGPPVVVQSAPHASVPHSYDAGSPTQANPTYVEQRLDQAGQQLLTGVSAYFSRAASELLQPAPTPPASSFSPPTNAYRY